VRAPKALFLCLILLVTVLQPVLAINDYGEDEDYLGQVVDDYLNEDYVQTKNNVIRNDTLGCMELNYTDIPGITDEDFTTYTEVDVEGTVSKTASRITFTSLDRDDTAYVYKDFGENYFSGDFSMNVTMRDSSAYVTAWVGGWALWNEVDDTAGCWGGTGIQVYMYRAADVGWRLTQWTDGGATSDISLQGGYSTKYLTIERHGNRINCEIYNDEARTILYDNLTVTQNALAYRYIYGLQSLDSGDGDYMTGYIEKLNLGAHGSQSGYEDGEYYTTEMLDGDRALTLMYNVSIPEYCGATIEFSSDNSTWVDHNNNAGSDTLTVGFESLDLRDLNTASLYMRVNMTTNNWDTPRIYQLRLVTITDVVLGDGEAPALSMGKYYALAIILLILGILLGLGMRKR